MNSSPSVHDRLLQLLQSSGATFRVIQHEPTPTSADSARARGEPLGAGAKALVVRADDRFCLLVIPADAKLDSKLARKSLGVGSLRFASPDELKAVAGLPPGSIPPFGAPLFDFPLFADRHVGQRFPNVAFNAGSLMASVVMPAADWERVAQPKRVELAGSADLSA